MWQSFHFEVKIIFYKEFKKTPIFLYNKLRGVAALDPLGVNRLKKTQQATLSELHDLIRWQVLNSHSLGISKMKLKFLFHVIFYYLWTVSISPYKFRLHNLFIRFSYSLISFSIIIYNCSFVSFFWCSVIKQLNWIFFNECTFFFYIFLFEISRLLKYLKPSDRN